MVTGSNEQTLFLLDSLTATDVVDQKLSIRLMLDGLTFVLRGGLAGEVLHRGSVRNEGADPWQEYSWLEKALSQHRGFSLPYSEVEVFYESAPWVLAPTKLIDPEHLSHWLQAAFGAAERSSARYTSYSLDESISLVSREDSSLVFSVLSLLPSAKVAPLYLPILLGMEQRKGISRRLLLLPNGAFWAYFLLDVEGRVLAGHHIAQTENIDLQQQIEELVYYTIALWRKYALSKEDTLELFPSILGGSQDRFLEMISPEIPQVRMLETYISDLF